MWICNGCHTENDNDNPFCIECGMAMPEPSTNHCSNPNCKFYNVILPKLDQKYCGKCGAATTFWKKIQDLT